MPRPRILLLRSGRHLQVALDALRSQWPDGEIAVVGTSGSEAALAQAGIDPAHTFIYSKRNRYTPLSFFLSATSVAARRWRFNQVAVLWNDPDGSGQGNVDRTAFLLAPRGFVAITPDGRVTERRLWPQVYREMRRAVASILIAIVLGALYLTAVVLPSRRM